MTSEERDDLDQRREDVIAFLQAGKKDWRRRRNLTPEYEQLRAAELASKHAHDAWILGQVASKPVEEMVAVTKAREDAQEAEAEARMLLRLTPEDIAYKAGSTRKALRLLTQPWEEAASCAEWIAVEESPEWAAYEPSSDDETTVTETSEALWASEHWCRWEPMVEYAAITLNLRLDY